jgi:hypothetical protein
VRASVQKVQELFDGNLLWSTALYHGHGLTSSQKALQDKGVDKMLSEAREGTVETDAEHLRR